MLKRGVYGKKNEWRVDVREHENNGEWAIEKKVDRFAREVQILEQAVEHAIAAQDCFPGVTANEVADPQRHDHKLIQEFLARTRVEGEVVRERIAEEQRAECHGTSNARGAQKNLKVWGIGEQ